MVGKKKIQVVYWKYRHTIYKIRQKLYLPQICFHNHLKNIWYLVICAVLFPWYNFAINMSFNKYWVAQFVFRLSCQDSLWATKLFFQQLYLQSTVRRDFLPLGGLHTWKVMTALILGFPANLLLLLTGDVTPTHKRLRDETIGGTRSGKYHTHADTHVSRQPQDTY